MKLDFNNLVEVQMEDEIYIFSKGNKNMLIKLESSAVDYYNCIKNNLSKLETINFITNKYGVDKNIVELDYLEFCNQVELELTDSSVKGQKYCDIEIDEYINELNKLQKYYKDNYRAFRVFVEVTYNCNLECKHCYLDKSSCNYYMTFENAKRIFDDLEKNGVVHVLITGGEPFLNPDIYEIIEYASQKNFLLTILTNGTLIRDNDIVSRLKKYDIFDIRISLHGNEINHDDFTGRKNSYYSAIKSIKTLNEHCNLGTGVYVANKTNCKDIDYITSVFKKNNWNLDINTIITPTTGGNLEPIKERIGLEQYNDIIKNNIFTFNGTSCTAGLSRMRITPYGDLIPCELFPIKFGNIFKENMKTILNSDNRKYFIHMFNYILETHSCTNCKDIEMCNFCPGIFLTETGSFNSKSNYICQQTKAKVSYLEHL